MELDEQQVSKREASNVEPFQPEVAIADEKVVVFGHNYPLQLVVVLVVFVVTLNCDRIRERLDQRARYVVDQLTENL